MSALTVMADCSPGSSIEDCAKEACDLSRRLQINVGFDFNGVRCMAVPHGNAETLVADWHDSLASKRTYKLAHSARRR